MGKENEALDLVQVARKLTNNGSAQPPAALTWYTPVRFDPGLLKKLLDEHDVLDTRIAALPNRFRRDREEAWRSAQACAGQLHELRRQEALWLYPVIAHGLDSDIAARSQLMSLRLMMNGLARRVLRSLEELARTIRQVADIHAGVTTVSHALAEYRQRNETELYTLYSLMNPHRIPVAAASRSSSSK
jgi:hypothetical protein